MYRFFVSLVFIFFVLPAVVQANASTQSAIIDKIVQDQAQWKQEWEQKVATSRALSGGLNSPKIVGGSIAVRGQHPEFALLLFTNSFGDIVNYCGGTLIDSNKVLTAAHCTINYSTFRTFVIPNFYSFNDNLTDSDIFSVSRKYTHPNYISSSFDYDISVLTLIGNSDTPTAKLFGGENLLVNFPATVIGVGTLSEGGTAPENLHTASIPVVSNLTCINSYGAVISDRMMCAGLVSGGVDTCQGDSGGPLWVNFEGQKVQAGITSFGQGCARPNFYGVYSRISSLTEFVQQYAPDAEFVVEAKLNIIPFIQPLLLDEFKPPICNLPINLGDTIKVRFEQYCFDNSVLRYYKTFTFTIDQAREVSISAISANSYLGNIRLFSGDDTSGLEISNDDFIDNKGNIVEELDAGTYTIEVTNTSLGGEIDINLTENICEFTSVSLNLMTQASFSPNCRSLTSNDHVFARYYTFTLTQDQQVSITAPRSTDFDANVRLFSGTDFSRTYLDNASTYYSEAVLLNELIAGTYTIELTRSDFNALIDLDIRLNKCDFTSIDLGATVQSNFTSDCRSFSEYNHPYARYYSFIVNQRQDISISAVAQNNDANTMRLFSGTDVFANSIRFDRFFQNQAAVLITLDPGVYTIEISNENLIDSIDLSLLINDCPSIPVTLNSSIQASYTANCRSFNSNDHIFASYYTFTLTQDQHVTITSPNSLDFNSVVRLYAGIDVTGAYLDSGRTYADNVILLNELTAGTYTIELTRSNVNALTDMNISLNQCDSSPINIGETVQSTFTGDCRSVIEYSHPHASYYTFTLGQTRTINLAATTQNYNTNALIVFSGTDVTTTPIKINRFFNRQALIEVTLDAGTYTVELTSDSSYHIIDLSLL